MTLILTIYENYCVQDQAQEKILGNKIRGRYNAPFREFRNFKFRKVCFQNDLRRVAKLTPCGGQLMLKIFVHKAEKFRLEPS